MANFVFSNVSAVGTAQLQQDGSLIQPCMVITAITGIVAQNKTLNDFVEFLVPNSVMANQQEPLNVAWTYIQDILAPQYVTENYSDI